MRSIAFAFFFIISAFLSLVQATNYCSSTINCGTSVNIGCNNNGSFASTCPASRVMVTMTAALQQAIINKHNTLRNIIAGGKLTGFLPAVRMATMRWDNELATLASYNVKRCLFAHDACHNTDTFLWSGQNLAETWWTGYSPNDTDVILPQIDAWWAENKDATMANINSYPTNPSAVIGHFTVMTADKNIALGCAGIRYKDPAVSNWDSETFACNYAATNIYGHALYVSGTTASKCTTGKNPTYPALCSISEVYNVNTIV